MQAKRLVYVDESGFAEDIPRTDEYSKQGERCYGSHYWGAKGRANVIGALIGQALLTVFLLSGTVNSQVFGDWIEIELLPKLPPNSVIVMDNASFYKAESMKVAIANARHSLIYLPAYSPDLNPIEHKWAQAKHIRRSLSCSVDSLFRYHVA